MKTRFILFDAYGTLLSTGTASVDATRAILQKRGRPDLDASEFYVRWKCYRTQMIRTMTDFVCEAEVFRTTLHMLYREYCIDGNADEDIQLMLDTWGRREAFCEVRQVLEQLSQTFTLCIGSTTDTAPLMRDLARNEIDIQHVYTSESLAVYKPHRAFYKMILDDLQAHPDEVLFAGDSLTDDVWGPARLGIKTCHVNRKNTPYRDIIPDATVSSLNELPALLIEERL